MRQQLEGERGFARRSVGNRGAHREAVLAVRQAVVIGHAPRHRADPLAIQSFQPVGITHPLRSAEIDPRVSELHAAVARRELGAFGHRDRASVHRHLEQMNHGRRQRQPADRSDRAPPSRGWWETTGVRRCFSCHRGWSDIRERTARCAARPPRRSSPARLCGSCRSPDPKYLVCGRGRSRAWCSATTTPARHPRYAKRCRSTGHRAR